MSLFDVIKYSSTDLSSLSEVRKLPKRLQELYIMEERRGYDGVANVDIAYLCFWYNHGFAENYKSAFKHALSIYANESL